MSSFSKEAIAAIGKNVEQHQYQLLLSLAASEGYPEIVQDLLDRGANPDQPNEAGNTPLCAAASAGNLEIVQHLLAMGAHVNQPNGEGNTPLHTAAAAGKLEIVELLLKMGADVNQCNNHNNTPLLAASCRGYLEIVQALKKQGAYMTVVNKNGGTLLHTAIEGLLVAEECREIQVEIVESLLENDEVDVNGVGGRYNERPLFSAIRALNATDSLQMIVYLIAHGASFEDGRMSPSCPSPNWSPGNAYSPLNGSYSLTYVP